MNGLSRPGVVGVAHHRETRKGALRLAAAICFVALLASVLSTRATPYATCLTNSGGTVSFRLNEAADDVKVIGNAGTLTNDLGAISAVGLTVTNLTGTGMTGGVFRVSVAKAGSGAIAQIGNISIGTPRGVAVNQNPASPYFGRVYGASATATNTAGIYVYNADLSSPFGVATSQRTAGYDWITGANFGARPLHLAVATNDQVFICDWSDASGNLIVTDPDVSSYSYVLKQLTGTAAVPVGSANNHGSVQSVAVSGSLADGNLKIYTVDEDYQTDPTTTSLTQLNGLWFYNIGAGPLPWSNAPTLLAVPSIGSLSQNNDVARGLNGFLYYNQRRANASGPPGTGTWTPSLFVVNPTNVIDRANWVNAYNNDPANQPGQAGCVTLSGNYWSHGGSSGGYIWDSQSASSDVGSNGADYLADISGVGVSPDGKYLAGITYNTAGFSSLVVVPLTNGIPDLTRRITFATGLVQQGRGLAWDAADNIYLASHGSSVIRVYTLGGNATVTTGSDGAFSVVLPSTTVSVSASTPMAVESGPTSGQFTIARTAPDISQALPVNFTMTGTAARGAASPSDYTLKTNGVALSTNTVVIPAGAASVNVEVAPIFNNVPELTTTAIFNLAGGANYQVSNTLASATVAIVDAETPQLRIASLSTNIFEGTTNDYALLTLVRYGDTNQSLVLDATNFSFSGTAVSNVDYHLANLPATIGAGVVTQSIRLIYPYRNSTNVGSLSLSLTMTNQPGNAFTVLSNTASTFITLEAVAPENVLWKDNFENPSGSANWTVFFATATNSVNPYDATVDFHYDYSIAQGHLPALPVAPHSLNGETHGVFLTVNKNDSTAAAAALNLYPIGRSFSNNFALRFDMYLVVNSGSSSTEYGLFGINHSGAMTNWFRNSGLGVDSGWAFDGLFYEVESDGSGLGDYVLRSSPTVTSAGIVGPSTLAARTASTLTQVFKNPPYNIPASLSGAPANLPGSTTPSWAEVEISQSNNVATLKINNTTILSYTNAGAYTKGNIVLGYEDAYDAIGNLYAGSGEACVVYDNVRVVNLDTQAPLITAQPTSQTNVVGTNVTFTVSATGTPTLGYQWQLNGVNLANTGRISGAQSAALTISSVLLSDQGSYQLIVSNAYGSTNSAVATLTLTKGNPTITWANPAPITYGAALTTSQLGASASVAGTYAYTPDVGAVLTAGTKTLSVVFSPTDAVDYNAATGTVSLVVQPAAITVTANGATRSYGMTNPAFGGTLVGVTNGDNITASYTCSATPASPPGAYSIVPSLSDPSSRLGNYSVTANNGTLTVTCASISLSPVGLLAGSQGVAYSQTLTATGGAPTYTFAVVAGGLPGGLSLSASGGLTGTPSAPISTNFTVTVTDANGCGVTQAYALTILSAGLILSDDFNYSNGPIAQPTAATANPASTWLANSGSASGKEIDVTNGTLIVADFRSEDMIGLFAGQPYMTNGPTTALYARYRLNCQALPTSIGNYLSCFAGTNGFAAGGANISGLRARIWATATNYPGGAGTFPGVGQFNLGIVNCGFDGNGYGLGATNFLWSVPLNTNTTYTVVTRYVLATGASTLWVNPSSESDPGITDTNTLPVEPTSGLPTNGILNLNAYELRQAAGEGTMLVDELRVGTSFAAVVACPTIHLTPTNLAGGTLGVSYSQSLTATGGVPVYAFAVTSGGLPGGLSLSANGVLSGTPSAPVSTNFTVTATDTNGCAGSLAYTLSILGAPPSITGQPQSQSVAGGANVGFSAAASGTAPLGYQWQFNGTDLTDNAWIIGSHSNSLTIVNVGLADAGTYTLTVSNAWGSTNSQPALLSVYALTNTGPYAFTNFAGQPGVPGSADGTGSGAQFNGPYSLVVDHAGNVFIPDAYNYTIRKVTSAGVVTTVAGTPGVPGSADGTNGGAQFNGPVGLAVDRAGNLYVADYFNSTIRKATPSGTNWVVSTLAGLAGSSGSVDGTNSSARFSKPIGVAADSAGNLYVTGNETVRKVTPDGVVTTIAGLAGSWGSADGIGSSARFDGPGGVALDSAGNLYLADSYNHAIRKLTPAGTNWSVSTIAGLAGVLGSADGTGSAARFNYPGCVAVDGAGFLYVTDTGNYTIRKLTQVGTNWAVVTIGGLAGASGTADGIGSAARFNTAAFIAVDNAGELYLSDAVWGSSLGNNRITKGTPINCAAIALSPATLPAGTVGTAYSQSLSATGGTGPYGFTNTSGTLPAGLSLSGGGVLSGSPSASGTNTFTVTATDVIGCAGASNYTLVVVPNLVGLSFFWDADGSPNGNDPNTGANLGGTGVWNTSLVNWFDGINSREVAWGNANSNSANFAGVGGTITLGTPITANALTFAATGFSIVSSTLTLASGLIDSGGFDQTIQSVIAGSSGLTKTNGGVLTLGGNNIYSGATLINGGTLRLGANQGIPSASAVSIAAGGAALDLHGYNGTVGSLSGGDPSYTNVSFAGGSLTSGGDNTSTFFNGNMDSNGTFIKAGSGTFTQTNGITLGSIHVTSGVYSINSALRFGPSDGTATNAVTIEGGTIQETGSGGGSSFIFAYRPIIIGTNGATFDVSAGSAIYYYNGIISGNGSLTKTGPGELRTFAGTNGIIGVPGGGTNGFAKLVISGGQWTVGQGSLLAGDFSYGTVPASFMADNITIQNGATNRTVGGAAVVLHPNRGVFLGAGGGVFRCDGQPLTIQGAISGTGNLTKEGSRVLTLTGTNTFSGSITLDAGTLAVSRDDCLGAVPGLVSTNAIALNGGSLQAAANLTLDTKRGITLGSNGGGLITSGGNLTFSGVIAGPGPLTISGTKVVSLGTANTYLGGTVINGGKLFARNATGSATGSGGIAATNGVLGGDGTLAGAVITAGTNVLTPGYAYVTDLAGTNLVQKEIAKLTLQNGLDMSNGGVYFWQLGADSIANPGTDFDQVELTGGNLVLGGGAVLSINFTNVSGPDPTNSFWAANHSWRIIKLSGSAANPGSSNFTALSNAVYAAGTFATSVDTDGSILLNYTSALVPPTITVQPSNQTNLAGTTVSFSVTANGSLPLAYRWRFNGVDLADVGRVSGAGSSTLTINGLITGDAGNYSLVVTNPYGAATSAVATLTVTCPAIALSPALLPNGTARGSYNQTLSASGGTSPSAFVVTAGSLPGGLSLSNNGALTGTLGAPSTNTFTVTATDTNGCTGIQAYTLAVPATPPSIIVQPQSRTNFVGTRPALTVTATGSLPLSYQWQFGGVDLPGATNATLGLGNVQLTNAGSYSVMVTNAYGAVTSATVVLTVRSPAGFGVGNLAVLRAGDGGGALSSAGTALFVDEYTPAGVFVQTLSIPASGSNALVVSGSAVAEAVLTVSRDGLRLCLAGYNTDAGYTNVPRSPVASVPRGAGVLDDSGAFSLKAITTSLYDTNNIRAAVTDGTNSFWAGGAVSGLSGGSVSYLGFDAPANQVYQANVRVVEMIDGELYFSSAATPPGAGVHKFNGAPTSSATPAAPSPLIPTGGSPYGFAISPAGDVAYVADDTQTTAGGVIRYTKSGGTWTYAYTLGSGSAVAGARSLTVDWSGANPVIYATTSDNSIFGNPANRLIRIVDTGIGSSAQTLATAADNTSFRGIAFTPFVAPIIVAQPQNVTNQAGASVSFAVQARGSTPLAYHWRRGGTNLVDSSFISGSQSNVLTLASLGVRDAANYQVVVSNVAGSVTSSVAALTVVCPAIAVSPASLIPGTIGVGYSQSLAASGGTPPYTYAITAGTPPSGLSLAAGGALSGIPLAIETNTFTVTATDTNGCAGSQVCTLAILGVPAGIAGEPHSVTNTLGSNGTFVVTASGTPPFSYQWLKAGIALSAQTNSALTLLNLQTNDAGGYQVVVANSFGSATSGVAVLTINLPPTAMASASPRFVAASAPVNFSSAGSFDPEGATLSYNWDFGDNSTSAASNPAHSYGAEGDYTAKLTVSDGLANITSSDIAISVRVPPAITTQPQSQSVVATYPVAFSVAAVSTPPTSYQWLLNGIAIAGATSTSLSITNPQVASAGSYTVVVTNAGGSATSSNAVLTVLGAYTFSTFAGTAGVPGSDDGTGGAARFNNPYGLAVDCAGNVYESDSANSTIRKITPDGTVTTLAGLAQSAGSADGVGSVARFDDPTGVAVDGNGVLYVADTHNHVIRKVMPDGTVTTIAGLAGNLGSADGTNSSARFYWPSDVAIDVQGNLYVTDTANYTIRKLSPASTNWVVSTIAGVAGSPGSADGSGAEARFDHCYGLAVDVAGTVYVVDAPNATLRKLVPTATNWWVSTLAGSAGNLGSSDGLGSAARFNWPAGVGVDGAGNIYVADSDPSGAGIGTNISQSIRKVTRDGHVTTIAGLPGSAGSADGTGSAARFNSPARVAIDCAGNLYVTDEANFTIRKGLPSYNDNFADCTPIGGQTFNATANNAQASKEAGEPNHGGNSGGHSLWWSWMAPAGGSLVVDTLGSDVDTLLSIYTGDSVAGLTKATSQEENDLYHASRASIESLVPGAVYQIAVDGYNGASGNLVLNLRVSAVAPQISSSPQSQTVPAGVDVTFSAGANGSPPLWFQWLKDGTPVPGATNPVSPVSSTLILSNVQPADAGIYSLLVTNSFGSVTSAPAQLTVLSRPLNDAYTNAFAITGLTNTVTGTNANASQDGFEPIAFAGYSVWWKWTATNGGSVIVDTIGSSFGTVLGLWTNGPSGPALVAFGDQNGDNHTGLLAFEAAPGVTYYLGVDGSRWPVSGSNIGSIVLNLRESFLPPNITLQPQTQNVTSGSNVSFTVSATGTAPLNYQWLRNSVNLPGVTTSTLTIGSVQTGDAGSYNVVVSNAFGVVASSNATLTVFAPPTNDLFASRALITGLTNTVTGQNVGATRESGEPRIVSDPGGKSVWYTWTAPTNGTVFINTSGSSFDPLLGVYTGSSVSALTLVAAGHSSVVFAGVSGRTYQLAVDGGYDSASGITAAGNFVLNFSQSTRQAPLIVSQPQSQAVVVGGNATLAVGAAGTPAPALQWQLNGVALPGKTNATLLLSKVATNQAGAYSVVASNSEGSVTSIAAILKVDAAVKVGFRGNWPGFETGDAQDVVVADGFAYLATTAGLLILDISDPAQPRRVGSYHTDSAAMRIAMNGNYVYVLTSSNRISGATLSRFDVSNPALPQKVAAFVGSAASDFALAGDMVCVADGQSLLVLNADCALEGSLATSHGPARAVALAPPYAYVAWSNTIGKYDVSNPASPVEAAVFDQSARELGAAGGYLYTISGGGGSLEFRVLDANDQQRPRIGDSIVTSLGYADTHGLTVVGNKAFVVAAGHTGNALGIYDVSQPSAPQLTGRHLFAGDSPCRVAVADGFAYVANGGTGLRVFDLSDLTDPAPAGQLFTSVRADAVAMQGNLACVLDSDTGFHIVDVSDPNNPSLRGTHQSAQSPGGIAVQGRYAYLALDAPPTAITVSGASLEIVDITSPDNPVLAGSTTLPSPPQIGDHATRVTAFAVQGNVALVGSSLTVTGADFAAVAVADVSAAAMPHPIARIDLPGPARVVSIAYQPPYAYLADAYSGLKVFDLSNPGKPVALASFAEPPSTYSVFVQGNLCFLSGSYGSLVFDVSQPSHPILLGTNSLPAQLAGMPDPAILGSSTNALSVFDLSYPLSPVPLGQFGGTYNQVSVQGRYGFAAGGQAGLTVVDLGAGFSTAPAILIPPADARVLAGNATNFFVAANGTVPLSYQWRLGGTNLPGATDAFLSLAGVQSRQAGQYSVQVANSSGTVTSAVAVLSIDALPTVALSSPFNSQVFSSPADINLVAAASDDRMVAQVAFYNGESRLGVTTGPFSLTWSNVPAGTYSLHAVATDDEGATNTSAPITVVVATNISVFQLSQPNYTAYESNGLVTVTVHRNSGETEASVGFQTLSSSAKAVGEGGVGNYYAVSTQLVFAVGVTARDVPIQLVNDLVYRGQPVFHALLENPSPGWTLANPTNAAISIVDDDSTATTFSFTDVRSAQSPPSHGGSLTVTLLPTEAQGQWRFAWENLWRLSGSTATNLAPGAYPIVFQQREGMEPLDPIIYGVGTTNASVTMLYSVAAVTATGSLGVTSLGVTFGTSGIGQWRLAEYPPGPWQNNGASLSDIPPGQVFIEFNDIAGYLTPASLSVQVIGGSTVVYDVPYTPVPTPAPPGVGPVALTNLTAIANTNAPYQFNGQLVTAAGSSSGFVVNYHTVLTAAHALFDSTALTWVTNAWWFFQSEAGEYQPAPQVPRGWLKFAGYAAARTNDFAEHISPDAASTATRQQDVAALFFSDSAGAGRGGYGGYLTTVPGGTDWLLTDSWKLLIGYPVASVPRADRGRMHRVVPDLYSFSQVVDTSLASSTDLKSYPGNSGGPLCVQSTDSLGRPVYLPAAIYLGGSSSSIVRSIDLDVADLIRRAEALGVSGGDSFTGGGVITITAGAGGTGLLAYLQVAIGPPEALAAGGRWRVVQDNVTNAWSSGSGYTLAITSVGAVTLEFKSIPGWDLPSRQALALTLGATTVASSLYTRSSGQLAVSPAGGLVASGYSGGPLSPASMTYTLTNAGGASLSWTASKTADWLTLSAASGTLAAGAAMNVTVSLGDSANRLAPGSYSDTVSFSSQAPGLGSADCPITLNVISHPLVQLLSPSVLSDGSIRMILQGLDKGVYSIIASPSLLDPIANWRELLRLTNTGSQTVFTNPPPSSSPYYYRAKEL